MGTCFVFPVQVDQHFGISWTAELLAMEIGFNFNFSKLILVKRFFVDSIASEERRSTHQGKRKNFAPGKLRPAAASQLMSREPLGLAIYEISKSNPWLTESRKWCLVEAVIPKRCGGASWPRHPVSVLNSSSSSSFLLAPKFPFPSPSLSLSLSSQLCPPAPRRGGSRRSIVLHATRTASGRRSRERSYHTAQVDRPTDRVWRCRATGCGCV